MAADLTPVTISAPGFYGLNTQDSPIGLPPEYALEAKNCVIDKLGRIAARKGWAKVSAYDAGIGSDYVTLIHEHVKDDGTTVDLFIANGHIWSLNRSTGAVTDVYTGTWTSAGTLSGDKGWKAVSFNGYSWFFKRGEDPLQYDPAATPKVAKVSTLTYYSGTVQQANEVLSAYGRLWTADTSTDKVTIKWSDTLIGEAWTGGASGSVSIDTVLTNGTRPIVALAAFNGFLIVFCDTVIVIYSGADADPATDLALVDVIEGVGCISRDSVQDVGNDILFLSATGVRSLGRIINEKSAPLYDISRNVRDQLISDVIANADNTEIVSCYSDLDGFYLLSLKSLSLTYCFDLKNRLENNVCRVTTWSLVPKCYAVTTDKSLLMGFAGYVGEYGGYTDDNISYRMEYKTSHLAGSDEQTPLVKILKSTRFVIVEGGGYTLNLRWGFDYQGIPYSATKALEVEPDTSEYNVDEYGTALWGDVSNINILRSPLKGFGQTFQFNIGVLINGTALSIQQIDIFFKLGRLA